jgi:hypothetical protein
LEDGGSSGEDGESKEKAAPTRVATPEINVTQVASQIVGEVMRSLANNAQQQNLQQRPTATQAWVEEMVRDGADPKAIKALLRLKAAQEHDNQQVQQVVQPAAQVDRYNAAVWEMADEIFEELQDSVPGGFEDSKDSLMKKAQRELMSNPDFAADQLKIQNFQKPSRKGIKLAMAIVMDKKLKAEGRTNVSLPIDRSANKPAALPTSNPLDNLNKSQREFYNQFKSEYKGQEKELLKIAKSV